MWNLSRNPPLHIYKWRPLLLAILGCIILKWLFIAGNHTKNRNSREKIEKNRVRDPLAQKKCHLLIAGCRQGELYSVAYKKKCVNITCGKWEVTNLKQQKTCTSAFYKMVGLTCEQKQVDLRPGLFRRKRQLGREAWPSRTPEPLGWCSSRPRSPDRRGECRNHLKSSKLHFTTIWIRRILC